MNFNTTLVIVYREPETVRSLYSLNFNTTLVIVYRLLHFTMYIIPPLFQYNSCYCLSRKTSTRERLERIFQYNSCYCLSRTGYRDRKLLCKISIQLLLLFIRFRQDTRRRNGRNFNTTLVIVYPKWQIH